MGIVGQLVEFVLVWLLRIVLGLTLVFVIVYVLPLVALWMVGK